MFEPPTSESKVEYGGRAVSLVALVYGSLWIVLWHHLAAHWGANPQYSFGWLVPPLTLYLMHRRWKIRPMPGRPPQWGLNWLIALLAFVFLPLWLIEQPNPDWRAVSWLLAADIVALSLTTVVAIGGARWARHFAFPICFVFVAIPWPNAAEQWVIQTLTRSVAAITVGVLNIVNIAALQHGNLIEVATGMLGVDEACSGVRSLQAALMASLFLGELFRLNVARRALLIAASLVTALATNIGRAVILGWTASKHGLEAITEWHDPAGFTILTICFVIVWLIAFLIDKGQQQTAPARDATRAQPLSLQMATSLVVWFLGVFGATELWFRGGPTPDTTQLRLVAPPGSTQVAIEPQAVEMLQYDRGLACSWQEEERSWVLFFFEWASGPSRSRILARMHRPEICLPATGMVLTADRGIMTVMVNGLALPFRAYTFDQGGRPIFVYFCLWENRPVTPGRRFSNSLLWAGLQAVLWRERNLAQQVVELVLQGCATVEEADAAFRRELPLLHAASARHTTAAPANR